MFTGEYRRKGEVVLISPSEALEIVLGRVRPLPTEPVAPARAAGRFLAEAVRAPRDMPPADRSAMDGYAVRAADLSSPPRELRLVGEVAAGSRARPRVRPGTCVRILTGANVPPGADAVVMQEHTAAAGEKVRFLSRVEPGENIRRRGEVARRRDVLLAPGALLGPVQVGLCAAAGRAKVRAPRLARVAVLVTGEEVRAPGQRVGAPQLRDSNGPALAAALDAAGVRDVTCRIVSDDPRELTARLRRAAGRDVIIVTGGVSVGPYDYVPEAVRRFGAAVRYHGVAMKPGRPQLYATFGRNGHLFGLPGNPLSVLTGFYEFVLPALRRLGGADASLCRPALAVTLGGAVRSRGDRATYRLARLAWTDRGPVAEPVDSRGSADVAAGGQADGVVVVPPGVRGLPAGKTAEFRPWRRLP